MHLLLALGGKIGTVIGARPLKRLIQTEILDELSMRIIEGEIKEGDIVVVDRDETGMVIRRKS